MDYTILFCILINQVFGIYYEHHYSGSVDTGLENTLIHGVTVDTGLENTPIHGVTVDTGLD